MWTMENRLRFLEDTGRIVAIVAGGAEVGSVAELDAAWNAWAVRVRELQQAAAELRAELVASGDRRSKVIPFPMGGRRPERGGEVRW
jgi:hypothetical protein